MSSKSLLCMIHLKMLKSADLSYMFWGILKCYRNLFQINKLLFPLKLSGSLWFSKYYNWSRSYLIPLKTLNVIRKIWWWFLKQYSDLFLFVCLFVCLFPLLRPEINGLNHWIPTKTSTSLLRPLKNILFKNFVRTKVLLHHFHSYF